MSDLLPNLRDQGYVQGKHFFCILFDISFYLIWYSAKIVSEYDQEIPQSQTAEKKHGTAKKSHTTITRRQEDILSRAASSLPHQDDCKTDSHNGSNNKVNNSRTIALERTAA